MRYITSRNPFFPECVIGNAMNLLLTSIGRRSYLVEYFKAALAGIGSLHVSNSSKTIATQSADHVLITPLIYDPSYIPTLLDYCLRNEITAIISLFDIDLLVLAAHRELFHNHGIRVLLAPEKSVRICNDKWATYQFLCGIQIPTPQTVLDFSEAQNAVASGRLSFPLIIKPRWGMGTMCVHEAETMEELIVLYKKAERDIFRSYLKYESQLTPANPVIIQEKLIGQEYGLDVLNDLNGEYVRTFAKAKLAMRAGETDIGQTVSSKEFEPIAICLSKQLRHEGILSVDCFMTTKGVVVLEMNCRISGHYPVSHLAGVDVPRQIIQWLRGGSVNDNYLCFREGLVIAKDLVPRIVGSA